MVAAVLAVVFLAVSVTSFLLFRRFSRPAFSSPDELARWATRLNVTAVQFTWYGGIRHVVIEPKAEAPAVEELGDDAPADEAPEVAGAFDVFRKRRRSA